MSRPLLFLGIAALVILLLTIGISIPYAEWLEWTRTQIHDLGPWGVITFIILYVVVTVVMVPALPLTISAGLIYGAWGFPLVLLSANLAACTAFFLARSCFHAYVSHRMKEKIVFEAIRRAVIQEQWKVVILLRLSPLLSFAMQNYVLAVTDVRFLPYAAGTAIGMTPAIALYVYIGSLGSMSDDGWITKGLLLLGIIATITVVTLISYRTRHALEQIRREYKD